MHFVAIYYDQNVYKSVLQVGLILSGSALGIYSFYSNKNMYVGPLARILGPENGINHHFYISKAFYSHPNDPKLINTVLHVALTPPGSAASIYTQMNMDGAF